MRGSQGGMEVGRIKGPTVDSLMLGSFFSYTLPVPQSEYHQVASLGINVWANSNELKRAHP